MAEMAILMVLECDDGDDGENALCRGNGDDGNGDGGVCDGDGAERWLLLKLWGKAHLALVFNGLIIVVDSSESQYSERDLCFP